MADFAGRNGMDVDTVKKSALEFRDISKKYGEFALDASLAAGGVLPPPFGTAADAASLTKSLVKRDWWGAVFDVIGFVPVVGDAIKGGRTAWKLKHLGRIVDDIAAGMAKSFRKTEDLAEKFWKMKRNDAAYKKALAACNGKKECLDAAALKKGQQYKSTPKNGNGGNWNPPEGRGDGEWVPDPGSDLAKAIHPEKSITYENGFPKFDPFSKGEVKIPQTGSSRKDMGLADEMFKKQTGNPDWTRPDGYTWHHKEDGTTMQLVPSKINNDPYAGHAGGQALFGKTQTGKDF